MQKEHLHHPTAKMKWPSFFLFWHTNNICKEDSIKPLKKTSNIWSASNIFVDVKKHTKLQGRDVGKIEKWIRIYRLLLRVQNKVFNVWSKINHNVYLYRLKNVLWNNLTEYTHFAISVTIISRWCSLVQSKWISSIYHNIKPYLILDKTLVKISLNFKLWSFTVD